MKRASSSSRWGSSVLSEIAGAWSAAGRQRPRGGARRAGPGAWGPPRGLDTRQDSNLKPPDPCHASVQLSYGCMGGRVVGMGTGCQPDPRPAEGPLRARAAPPPPAAGRSREAGRRHGPSARREVRGSRPRGGPLPPSGRVADSLDGLWTPSGSRVVWTLRWERPPRRVTSSACRISRRVRWTMCWTSLAASARGFAGPISRDEPSASSSSEALCGRAPRSRSH